MKLKQVNEGQECPKCKKFNLVQSHGYQYIANDLTIMWDYSCTNCNAKFIDEDLIKKQKGGKGNE